MSIGQQNTAARHLTIRYYEPTYICVLWLKENFVYFPKRPCIRMCKIYSSRLTSELNREQSQIIYSVCLCCFVFKEAPMNGNCWQTGGVEVAFSFGLSDRFPDHLFSGQQYLSLNRKPRIWLPVVDYPRARGRVADAGLNARGLWERDWIGWCKNKRIETGREILI